MVAMCVIFGIIGSGCSLKVSAQNYEGTEFFFAFINNLVPFVNAPPTFDVSIHAIEDATVTVEFGQPGDPFFLTQSLDVAAGTTGVINFPNGFLYEQEYFLVSNRTFYASSTGLVRLHVFHNREFFSDASAILPATALGTQYRSLALPAQNVIFSNRGLCTIVAVEDNTEIVVVPNFSSALGPIGTPATINLNARQSYTFAIFPNQDLSGTLITSSSDKPIAVFCGNDAVKLGPLNCDASSHVYEQVTPVSDWGSLHPIVPIAGAGGDYLRVVAHVNDTELYNGCELITTLNAGQRYSAYVNDPFLLYSTAPVLVGIFTPGWECSSLSTGDPNFRLVLPLEKAMFEARVQSSQMLNQSFPGVPQNTAWFVHVAMPTNQTNQLLVNGAPVANWQPFGFLPDLSFARIAIPDVGAQPLNVASSEPFWAELIGLGPADAKTMSLGSTTLMDIPEYQPLVFDLGPDITLCPGDMIVLDPGLGLVGTWQDGSVQETYTLTEPGEYSVTISGACNTNSTGGVTASFIAGLDIVLPPNYTFCENEVLDIGVPMVNGILYQWSTGDTTAMIVPDGSGVYVLTASLGSDCLVEAETSVEIAQLPSVVIIGPDVLCEGTSSELAVLSDQPGSYSWSDGTANAPLEIDTAGSYTLLFTSYDGCSIALDYSIDASPSPILEVIAPSALCLGDTAEIIVVSDALDLLWENGSNHALREVTLPGTYSLVASDAFGCEAFADILIEGKTTPEIASNDISICEGESARLVASAEGAQIFWQDDPLATSLSVTEPGLYIVTATNACGTQTKEVAVTVRDCSCAVYVPNAFTPNNDGLNENFGPVFECQPDAYEFRIYNRWGEEIYRSNDLTERWNGSVRNGVHYTDIDVYQWVLTYEHVQSRLRGTQLIRGTVTVIR